MGRVVEALIDAPLIELLLIATEPVDTMVAVLDACGMDLNLVIVDSNLIPVLLIFVLLPISMIFLVRVAVPKLLIDVARHQLDI